MRQIKFRAWNKDLGLMQYGKGAQGRFLDEASRLGYPVMQFTGNLDKNEKEIYEGDVVHVYDTENYCGCDEWEDCEAPSDSECKEHGEHKHEKHGDCSKYICTQEVKWSYSSGYFCDEDTGDFCPPLGADEIEMEIIGNIYENPELLK